MRMKRWGFLILIVSLLFGLVGCTTGKTSKPDGNAKQSEKAQIKEKGERFVYTKYDLPINEKVALGEKEAPHTITFVFDYACPWCKKWMLEVLPEVEKAFVQSGKAKYVSQPVSLLSIKSFHLAMTDEAVEKFAPEKYFEFQKKVAHSLEKSHDKTDAYFGSEEHIKKTLEELGLNVEQIMQEKEKMKDNLTITRNYTKNLDVKYVPTVYVDGIKISDTFSLEEMEKVLNGEIKEGDITYVKEDA